MQTKSFVRKHGIECELNWFARFVYKYFGFTGVVIFKSILIMFAITVGVMLNYLGILLILSIIYVFAVIYNHFTMKDNDRFVEEQKEKLRGYNQNFYD